MAVVRPRGSGDAGPSQLFARLLSCLPHIDWVLCGKLSCIEVSKVRATRSHVIKHRHARAMIRGVRHLNNSLRYYQPEKKYSHKHKDILTFSLSPSI